MTDRHTDAHTRTHTYAHTRRHTDTDTHTHIPRQPAHPPSLASRFPRPSVFLGGHGAAPGRILISRHYRTKETNLIRKPRSWCQNPRMSNCSDLSFADILLLFFSRNHICRDVRLQLEGRCQLRSHGPRCVFVCVRVCVTDKGPPPAPAPQVRPRRPSIPRQQVAPTPGLPRPCYSRRPYACPISWLQPGPAPRYETSGAEPFSRDSGVRRLGGTGTWMSCHVLTGFVDLLLNSGRPGQAARPKAVSQTLGHRFLEKTSVSARSNSAPHKFGTLNW